MLRALVLVIPMSFILALPAAASDSAAAKSVTIRVRWVVPASPSIKDVAPQGLRATGKYTKGDTVRATVTLRNAVRQFGKPRGARVGTGSFVVVALASRRIRGDLVTRFPGGMVHARGVVTPAGSTKKVPIVGGSGTYAGATGFLEVRRVLATGAYLNIYRLQVP
jgi:Allene oxide cyclase barrel like domain